MSESGSESSPSITTIKSRLEPILPLNKKTRDQLLKPSDNTPDNLTTSREAAIRTGYAFLETLPIRRALAVKYAVEMLEVAPFKRYFGLIDIVEEIPELKFSDKLRQINNSFDQLTGSLIFPPQRELSQTMAGKFFNSDRMFHGEDGIRLRGKNYFISLDKETRNPDKKIEVMMNDFQAGLEVIGNMDRNQINSKEELLSYLGVIDYLKMHSITLFHALTFNERYGVLPQEEVEYQRYLSHRQLALDLGSTFTRMYYQALIGSEFDHAMNEGDLLKTFTKLTAYLRPHISKSVQEGLGKPHLRFTYPEANHPLVLILGAQEAILKHPRTNLVVGIPSGGTELAFVTQMLYELIDNRTVDVSFLPVSLHSGVNIKLDSNELVKILNVYNPKFIKGKDILLVDDNSSTAQTLKAVADAFLAYNPHSIGIHVAEFDPRRLGEDAKFKDESYFNQAVSPSTLGVSARLSNVSENSKKGKTYDNTPYKVAVRRAVEKTQQAA